MIGKILSASLGAQGGRADHQGRRGRRRAARRRGAMSLARRLSMPALIALTAGGYAFKKWNDKKPRVRHPRASGRLEARTCTQAQAAPMRTTAKAADAA